MSASSRAIMLAALCLGVLLVGIELFITAVALPRILLDLAGWTELRRASWIINAYLVAFITAMPLAGRAADRFGLPKLVSASLLVFAVGSLLCGAAQDSRAARAGTHRPGRGRGGSAAAGHGWREPPVRWPRASPSAGLRRCRDVPRHGPRTGARRVRPRGVRAPRRPQRVRGLGRPAHRHADAELEVGVLRHRAPRTPCRGIRLGRVGGLGRAPGEPLARRDRRDPLQRRARGRVAGPDAHR